MRSTLRRSGMELPGLRDRIASVAKEGGQLVSHAPSFRGRGQLCLVLSEGDLPSGPTALYDLFRVENGKIVEHWDVLDAHSSAGSVEELKWTILGPTRHSGARSRANPESGRRYETRWIPGSRLRGARNAWEDWRYALLRYEEHSVLGGHIEKGRSRVHTVLRSSI